MSRQEDGFVGECEEVLAQVREGEAIGLGIRAAADGTGEEGVADDADGNR